MIRPWPTRDIPGCTLGLAWRRGRASDHFGESLAVTGTTVAVDPAATRLRGDAAGLIETVQQPAGGWFEPGEWTFPWPAGSGIDAAAPAWALLDCADAGGDDGPAVQERRPVEIDR